MKSECLSFHPASRCRVAWRLKKKKKGKGGQKSNEMGLYLLQKRDKFMGIGPKFWIRATEPEKLWQSSVTVVKMLAILCWNNNFQPFETGGVITFGTKRGGRLLTSSADNWKLEMRGLGTLRPGGSRLPTPARQENKWVMCKQLRMISQVESGI